MPVDTPLDITPPFTFSTVQFQSALLNTIVNSLVTVLIIANIVSCVSKLIYFSRGKSFSYDSWLRAYIFANSDDPLRIISWLAHNYRYRKRKYQRFRNKLKWKRLIVPLIARAIIFIIAIVSIGVTIPSDKRLSGCLNGDFRLVVNRNATTENPKILTPACLDIPITSERGKVNIQASYCKCYVITIGGETNGIVVKHFEDKGIIEVTLSFNNGEDQGGVQSYIEWKRTDILNGPVYRSRLADSVDINDQMDLAIQTVESLIRDPNCAKKQCFPAERTCNASLEACNTSPLNGIGIDRAVDEIEAHMRESLSWQETNTVQDRVFFSRTGDPLSFSRCPMEVIISRPIVNMVPLILTLLGWVIVNLFVSWLVSSHGNALDSGFHLIKEALGHDTTSNPLQENVERDELMELPLKLWRCGHAGAHIGFLGRAGDIPIQEFTNELIVCGCNRVYQDIENSEKMDTSMSSLATGTAAGTQYDSQSHFLRPP